MESASVERDVPAILRGRREVRVQCREQELPGLGPIFKCRNLRCANWSNASKRAQQLIYPRLSCHIHTSAHIRGLALGQMGGSEPLGRGRRVHVKYSCAMRQRYVVERVALERPQAGAGVDRRTDGVHSHHSVDGEGRVGIERERTSGRDDTFVLEGTKGTNVRGAVATRAHDRHSKARCSGRGPRAPGGSTCERCMSERSAGSFQRGRCPQ